MSYFAVDSSNYTINTSFALTRTSNIKGLTCSSNCTINTAGYFLSVSDISVNTGYTLILDNSGGGGISSSFNLNSGNLQLNLANDLPCNITNNGNLIFNLPYKDCIYYGSLSGLGTVKKTGAYNLTMTNNNTISGAIQVMTGTMTVNGTLLNSTLTIDSSANLSGFGSVGNVIISPNATISSNNINNGLNIGKVSNTLTTSNGIIISNNNVSCFPYIYKYANIIYETLQYSPDISGIAKTTLASPATGGNYTGYETIIYRLTFAIPIPAADIPKCIITLSVTSEIINFNGVNFYPISSLIYRNFNSTGIDILPKMKWDGVAAYSGVGVLNPAQMSLIIYKIA